MDQQEKALVEILAASVARAAEGQPPVGRGPAKKVTEGAEEGTGFPPGSP